MLTVGSLMLFRFSLRGGSFLPKAIERGIKSFTHPDGAAPSTSGRTSASSDGASQGGKGGAFSPLAPAARVLCALFFVWADRQLALAAPGLPDPSLAPRPLSAVDNKSSAS